MKDKALPTVTPEAVGIPSAAISKFVDAIDERKLGLHSFMLMRHGKVCASGWWAPYAAGWTHTMYSLTKSFSSTTMGFAVSDGLVTTTDFVSKYIGTPTGPYGDEMTIEHLLTMSTGHETDPTMEMCKDPSGDWVKGFLNQPVTAKPGSLFVYNSGASHMLSVIAQQVFGRPIYDVLQERLFEPLGISGIKWERDPAGHNCGGWGLHLKTEDIARFGQMLLQKGMWEGAQVVPREWVERATSCWVMQSVGAGGDASNDWVQGYGYQFWMCRNDAFRGDGAFGQYCIVMPKQDAVLAMTSGTPDMQAVLDCVWNILQPAMGEGVLADDACQQKALRLRLNMLQLPRPANARYAWPKGEYAGDGMRVAFEPGWMSVTEGIEVQRIAVGLDQWVAGWIGLDVSRVPTSPLAIAPLQRTATSAGWDGNTLTVRMHLTETPTVMEWQFAFDANMKNADVVYNPGPNMAGFEKKSFRIQQA